jgi:hypothetical protein
MNTKQDPNEPVKAGILNEAVDAILEGMEKMVGGVRGEIAELKGEMNDRFDRLEGKVNGNHKELKDEIDGLKAEFSTIPSRGEYEELKTKVNKVLSN